MFTGNAARPDKIAGQLEQILRRTSKITVQMGTLTDSADPKGDNREGPNALATRTGIAKGRPCLSEGLTSPLYNAGPRGHPMVMIQSE